MRVGIDYLPATSHASGIGRYARELVRAIVALDPLPNGPDADSSRAIRPDLALLDVGRAVRSVDPRALGLLIGDPHVKRVTSGFPRRLLRLVGNIGSLGRIDLFHHVRGDLAPLASRARTKQTIALAEMPEPSSAADARLARTLSAMDAVIVFSSEWARRVQSRYGVPGTRVHRVSVGCEHWRRDLAELPDPRPRSAAKPPAGSTTGSTAGSAAGPTIGSAPGPAGIEPATASEDPPIVLVLGARRPSRRHLTILRAVEKLRARGLRTKLLVLGAPGPSAPELSRAAAASSARADIEFRDRAPESEMPRLVARASVLVHLTDDESSPVTPLECFAMGVPVVASRIPAFEEALGGLADLLENVEVQRSPDLLADAIARAIEHGGSSSPEARVLRMRHAAGFTWERCARETIAIWTDVVAS